MVRLCTIDDLDAIVSLEEESFKSPLSKEEITRELTTNPLSFYLCYEENGVVIGYIGNWLTDIGSIINFAITKEYRNKGIGSKLLNETIISFRNNNINEISLDVRASNVAAIALYNKFNFKKVFVRKEYYKDKEDAIVMMRSDVE